MSSSRIHSQKKNLLLAFDAFGTLFQPNTPIPQAYGITALRHGIRCVDKPEHELEPEDYAPVKKAFSHAFKHESAQNPNYGKATGLGAEKWWANVIKGTFKPFLKPSQTVPQALVSELLSRYSTREGYDLFPDVIPFFEMLKNPTLQNSTDPPWPWKKTVVGIITNSDDRVPSVLESFGLKVGPRRVGSLAKRSAEATTGDDIGFVVLSYDVGFEKPDLRIFQAAEEMLKHTLADNDEDAGEEKVQGYEKLYVGDSLEHDYRGARAAGWNSILLERWSESNESLGMLDQVDLCTSLRVLHHWRPQDG